MKTKITKLPADLETPVGLYMKIRDLYPQSGLMESSDYHTTQNSISLIGVNPIGHFLVKNEKIETLIPGKEKLVKNISEGNSVTEELKNFINGLKDLRLDSPLVNGLLGYTAYDCVRHFEPTLKISKPVGDMAHIPDMLYILFRFIIPCAKATVAVIVLYYAVGYWNSWFNAMIYLQDKKKYPLQLFLREILLANTANGATAEGFEESDMLYLEDVVRYATIMVSTVPILCIYPFCQKYFMKGVMLGSVKE